MADFWLHLFDAAGFTPVALGRFLEGVVFQDPLCRLSGLISLATAAASWAALIGMTAPGPDDLEREIAERRRVEAELRKAEARYRTLVEQIPAVTFVASLDEGRSELYVSPQIEALAGYTAAEWRDDPILWYERVHPDDRGPIEVGLAEHHRHRRTLPLGSPPAGPRRSGGLGAHRGPVGAGRRRPARLPARHRFRHYRAKNGGRNDAARQRGPGKQVQEQELRRPTACDGQREAATAGGRPGRGRPQQGRVPGHAGPRAAQPPRPRPQRLADYADIRISSIHGCAGRGT